MQSGIVIVGRGTVKSSVLNFLGIKSQKKEVLNFLLPNEEAEELLESFAQELELHKPGHGIAFATPVLKSSRGVNVKEDTQSTELSLEVNGMFKKVTVIVDRGMAEEIMDAARKAGVTGGTIMHGRGAGAEHTSTLFGVEIEPEKELVVMLIPSSLVDKVAKALTEEFHLNEPGKGILFVEPIIKAIGLYQPKESK